MRTRLRAPNGTHTLQLEDTATVGDLLKEIRSKAGLQGDVECRIGYPPKKLELPSLDTLLVDLPIKLNGEQIIVSQTESTVRSANKALPVTGPVSGPLSNSHGVPFKAEERQSAPSKSSGSGGLFSFTPYNPSQSSSAGNRFSKPSGKDIEDTMNEPPVIAIKNRPGESMVLRIMEDDNSCLFRAVNYVFMRDVDLMTELRSLVAQAIQEDGRKLQDEQTYNDAILGMSRDKYCEKMQNPNTWGGAIELQILAKHFDMEIWSVDVLTGRIDKFNEGQANCGIVVYSGIHYDSLAMTPTIYTSDNDVTVFSTDDAGILDATLKLVEVLKQRKYFTDTAKFTIKCNVCQTGLTGEKQAIEHAKATGHSDFGEY